jgi:hypothetical protein
VNPEETDHRWEKSDQGHGKWNFKKTDIQKEASAKTGK